jgi:hypothetical protein
MRNILFILLISVIFSNSTTGNNNQGQSSGFAKIKFIDNNAGHSKTYLCKLTKGDIESLKFELKNNFTDPKVTGDDKSKSESDGYVDRVTAQKFRKEWKGNKQKANNDLLGNYEVKDEKSLLKIKEKKEKQKEEKASNTVTSGNYKKYLESKNTKRPNNYLSKNYRITGRRIHDGRTFKKDAGFVTLIIKYQIREGNYVNTYINIVDDYLKEGSNYNLKYHGNGSNRKYYLEFVSATLK